MLEFQPIKIDTSSEDEDGVLALNSGRLIAVLVRLRSPVHADLIGRWNMEAAFDGLNIREAPVFLNLEEAKTWIDEQLERHRAPEGR